MKQLFIASVFNPCFLLLLESSQKATKEYTFIEKQENRVNVSLLRSQPKGCEGCQRENLDDEIDDDGQNQKKTHTNTYTKKVSLDFNLLHIEPTQCLIWMVDFILTTFLNVIFFSVVKKLSEKNPNVNSPK